MFPLPAARLWFDKLTTNGDKLTTNRTVHPELVEGSPSANRTVHPELVEGSPSANNTVHPELVEGKDEPHEEILTSRRLK